LRREGSPTLWLSFPFSLPPFHYEAVRASIPLSPSSRKERALLWAGGTFEAGVFPPPSPLTALRPLPPERFGHGQHPHRFSSLFFFFLRFGVLLFLFSLRKIPVGLGGRRAFWIFFFLFPLPLSDFQMLSFFLREGGPWAFFFFLAKNTARRSLSEPSFFPPGGLSTLPLEEKFLFSKKLATICPAFPFSLFFFPPPPPLRVVVVVPQNPSKGFVVRFVPCFSFFPVSLKTTGDFPIRDPLCDSPSFYSWLFHFSPFFSLG